MHPLAPRLLLLVAVGGGIGSVSRAGVAELVGTRADIPLGTLGVNLVGAFCLGLLLERLAPRPGEHRRRRGLRLLLGTGFLGGFTTYSAFALEAHDLVDSGSAALGLAYVLATLAGGFTASVLGVAAGRRWRR